MPSYGADAVDGGPPSDDAVDIGTGAIYQYYHTPWVTVRESIPAIAAAGYDAIQVPPAQRSKRTWDDPAPRGYQPIDHLDFDSVFGTEREFRELIETAHDHGLDIIGDAVLNHMAASIPFEEFPHFGWDDFHHKGPIRDDEDDWELENRDLEGLPDLRQESERVRTHLEAYVQKYADLGVDGLRWDAVKHMPPWFFADYANPWAASRGLYTIGEVLHGSVAYCERYLETGMTVMDYPLYFTMREQAFADGGDFSVLDGAGLVARHPRKTVTFVSNHDSQPPEYERLAHVFVLLNEGVPRIYSGRIGVDDELLRTLLEIRRTYASGTAKTRHAERDQYVFERRGSLLVGLNRNPEWATVEVETSWTSQPLQPAARTGEPIVTDGCGRVQIDIPPTGWVCYVP